MQQEMEESVPLAGRGERAQGFSSWSVIPKLRSLSNTTQMQKDEAVGCNSEIILVTDGKLTEDQCCHLVCGF